MLCLFLRVAGSSEEEALIGEKSISVRVADRGPGFLHIGPIQLYILECRRRVLSSEVQEELLLLDRRASDKGAQRARAYRKKVLALKQFLAPNLLQNCLVWKQRAELTARLCVLEPRMLKKLRCLRALRRVELKALEDKV